MKSKFDWESFSGDYVLIVVGILLFGCIILTSKGLEKSKIIDNCLQVYAEQYCSSINMTYDSWGGDNFWCLDNNYNLDDERLGNDKSIRFCFLNEEKELCNGKTN